MNQLVIVRGLPGSGKSFMVDKLVLNDGVIFSTDDYWVRPDGLYDFNPKLLGLAHQWNQREFTKWVVDHCKLPDVKVFLDNTNVKWQDFRYYVETATTHGFCWTMIEPNTEWKFDPQELYERNTHGVPLDTIERMLSKWETTREILDNADENLRQMYTDVLHGVD